MNSRTSRRTFAEDLATKFGAILWVIEINESLLDRSDLLRLKAFGRQLRWFASR
jgi:hypothetical protein